MQLLTLPTTLLLLTSVLSVTAIPIAPSTAKSLQARQNNVETIGGGLGQNPDNSNTDSSNDKKNEALDSTVKEHTSKRREEE
ncbi:hypothetical protein HYFRA_00008793 [Hymenoscyphus fraxineus]|uniref:Uncharacterized protein n=1 Tax=Hymenoscyphus fraxineus TaxID=746836 RepID=A0A9N9PU76_9HELO|nr:hypothetical protein HYFRA_00008793 [Hymenoscyphus fraxineus]